jgi:hypothetical protein
MVSLSGYIVPQVGTVGSDIVDPSRGLSTTISSINMLFSRVVSRGFSGVVVECSGAVTKTHPLVPSQEGKKTRRTRTYAAHNTPWSPLMRGMDAAGHGGEARPKTRRNNKMGTARHAPTEDPPGARLWVGYRQAAPPPILWIPACAGMTNAGAECCALMQAHTGFSPPVRYSSEASRWSSDRRPPVPV